MKLIRTLMIVLLLPYSLQNAAAEKNGLERTPLLGWSSWSFLRIHPTATKMQAQARALKETGLQKLGYEYINLDDFWYSCSGNQGPSVGPYGHWVVDQSRFPSHGQTNGIKVVADYVHSLGLKFGIYVTPGISKQAVIKNTPIKGTSYTAAQIAEPLVAEHNYNCDGMVKINFNKPGAQEFINSWINLLAEWGIDYIKLDGMGISNGPDAKAWSKAIRQSGRPIVLNVTELPSTFAPLLKQYANQWVFTPDIKDIECYKCEKNGNSYPLTDWANIERRFNFVAEWQPYAQPGGFNDYDSIEVGNGNHSGLTPAERQTQLSLWALAAAPLILGADLTHLDPLDLKYLKNTAVLAVDQDAIAAKRILNSGKQQVFTKTESNGDVIVGLFNISDKTQNISIRASAIGLTENKCNYSAQNLWTGKKEKIGETISSIVTPHGVTLYRINSSWCLPSDFSK